MTRSSAASGVSSASSQSTSSAGHHDVARLAVGEVEDVVQQLLLRARDHPGPSASSTSARSSAALRIVSPATTRGCRTGAARAPPSPAAPRPPAAGDRDQLDRARDQRRERLRAVERQRLRHQLAEHDRQVGDDREGDHEGQPSSAARRRACSRTSGSASAPARMPIAVMPTCTVEITRTGSSISRSAACAPAAPASARGAARAARGDHRVLPDHEEGVGGDQAEHREDAEKVAHRAPASIGDG